MKTDAPSTPELYTLVRQTLRLARRFQQTLDEPLERELGLSIKELLVLAAVMDGAHTPGAVAERQALPAPTVTRIVSRLAEQGLLERASDPADLRRFRLRLTPAGEAARARIRTLGPQIVQDQFGFLPGSQVEAARAALEDLEAAFPPPRQPALPSGEGVGA